MMKALLAAGALAAFGCAIPANATTYTSTIAAFNGTDVYYDPGPFPSYLVGTFDVYAGTGTLELDGTFGNSVVPSSSGVDIFVGDVADDFYLIAQCFEGDPCSTSNTPTTWAATLTGNFDADTWSVYASQTSEYVVRLGAITETGVVTPEPSSLLLLGTGLLGTVGALRRRLVR